MDFTVGDWMNDLIVFIDPPEFIILVKNHQIQPSKLVFEDTSRC
jgi:hypothetical protein